MAGFFRQVGQQVQCAALPGIVNHLQEHRIGTEGAVPDGRVHANVILGNHTTRAQIAVASLGVSGLAFL